MTLVDIQRSVVKHFQASVMYPLKWFNLDTTHLDEWVEVLVEGPVIQSFSTHDKMHYVMKIICSTKKKGLYDAHDMVSKVLEATQSIPIESGECLRRVNPVEVSGFGQIQEKSGVRQPTIYLRYIMENDK